MRVQVLKLSGVLGKPIGWSLVTESIEGLGLDDTFRKEHVIEYSGWNIILWQYKIYWLIVLSLTETLDGYTTSPYPELDDFICRTVGDGGKNGYIRHWTYFPQGELLIYDIARYRWCANIQRQHRSNNIMLVSALLKFVNIMLSVIISFMSVVSGIYLSCTTVILRWSNA